MSWNDEVTLDPEQHVEMMAAVIMAGLIAPSNVMPNSSRTSLAKTALSLAQEIVRQNREGE